VYRAVESEEIARSARAQQDIHKAQKISKRTMQMPSDVELKTVLIAEVENTLTQEKVNIYEGNRAKHPRALCMRTSFLFNISIRWDIAWLFLRAGCVQKLGKD
jgi:hypothetical protein